MWINFTSTAGSRPHSGRDNYLRIFTRAFFFLLSVHHVASVFSFKASGSEVATMTSILGCLSAHVRVSINTLFLIAIRKASVHGFRPGFACFLFA